MGSLAWPGGAECATEAKALNGKPPRNGDPACRGFSSERRRGLFIRGLGAMRGGWSGGSQNNGRTVGDGFFDFPKTSSRQREGSGKTRGKGFSSRPQLCPGGCPAGNCGYKKGRHHPMGGPFAAAGTGTSVVMDTGRGDRGSHRRDKWAAGRGCLFVNPGGSRKGRMKANCVFLSGGKQGQLQQNKIPGRGLTNGWARGVARGGDQPGTESLFSLPGHTPPHGFGGKEPGLLPFSRFGRWGQGGRGGGRFMASPVEPSKSPPGRGLSRGGPGFGGARPLGGGRRRIGRGVNTSIRNGGRLRIRAGGPRAASLGGTGFGSGGGIAPNPMPRNQSFAGYPQIFPLTSSIPPTSTGLLTGLGGGLGASFWGAGGPTGGDLSQKPESAEGGEGSG